MSAIFQLLKKETRKILTVFSHPTFIYLTIVGNSILIVATVIVYYLERGPNSQINSYFDSLWWGISTITTVAYGDILPHTFLGRLIGIVLMYTGTVLFVSFTGVLMTSLMKEEVEEEIAPLQQGFRLEEEAQANIEKILKEILNRLERLERMM